MSLLLSTPPLTPAPAGSELGRDGVPDSVSRWAPFKETPAQLVKHLAHANGFPPGSYRKLIELLKPRYHVFTLRSRPVLPRRAGR